jgi:hypothetical protein
MKARLFKRRSEKPAIRFFVRKNVFYATTLRRIKDGIEQWRNRGGDSWKSVGDFLIDYSNCSVLTELTKKEAREKFPNEID